jgi:hypothetical protein
MGNYDSDPIVANCILWGNTAPTGAQISNILTSSPTVAYCDVEGSYPGTGNIDDDPVFVDAAGWDGIVGTEDDNLRLSAGSPCIDAGDNAAVPIEVATDLDGHPRILDGDCNDTKIVDMGAYEYLASDIDRSGAVDFADFSRFALYWRDTYCGDCGGADLTCDGNVDWNDLLELVAHWLTGK